MRKDFVALVMLMSTAGMASAQQVVVAAQKLEVKVQPQDVRVTAEDVVTHLMFFDRNHDGKVALCGPSGDEPAIYPGIERGQAERIQRIVALMQPDVSDRLQPVQGTLAVILRPRLRRMGEQDFHVSTQRRAAASC